MTRLIVGLLVAFWMLCGLEGGGLSMAEQAPLRLGWAPGLLDWDWAVLRPPGEASGGL